MAGGLGVGDEDVELGALSCPDAGGGCDVHARVADRRRDLGERARRVLDVDDEVDCHGCRFYQKRPARGSLSRVVRPEPGLNYGSAMVVAVFADAHAHAEALDAVIAAAWEVGAEELWSLGDMIGRGPDPEHAVARTRECCRVALMGNHDYGATGSAEPSRFGEPGSPAVRSIELARERLSADDVEWMRARKPAARREGVQYWHGGARHAVPEYVGAADAAPGPGVQRAELGLVGHTHVAAAWSQTPRGAGAAKIRIGEPLDVATGRWLLNPGAVGAPAPPRLGWWDGLDAQAAEGAFWLALDLERRTATWRRAPYDPAPARRRARELGLDDVAAGHP